MAANSRFAAAVHALAVLALEPEGRASSAGVAESLATNPVVARRLLGLLQRAGLVDAVHGARGGFRLARPPERITLLQIRDAVDEDRALFAQRPRRNERCPVACRMKSALEAVFARLEAKVAPELERATLAQIVRRVRA